MIQLPQPIRCETVPFERIDYRDPIFESIRLDYPDLDMWHENALRTAALRCGFVVRAADGSYAGIAILKSGEGPDGPSPTGLKLATFRVSRDAEAQGVADVLLSRVFERAIELEADVIFATVLPGHEDLTRFLELRGFRRAARESERGECIYVADMGNPERMYSQLSRLAFDVLAQEYRGRSDAPGPSQEAPEYLAGLLASRLPSPIRRVLELGPGSGSVLLALGRIAADTVAVEISPKMAAIAALRAPDALIVISDVLTMEFPEHSFDGVYAGAFLHLFPHRDAAELVQRIARWTKPGGAVFVNTSISDRSSESIEVKADYVHRVARFRSRWTEEQFRQLVECNGLSITDRITTDEHERNKFWVAFLCTPRHRGEHFVA